MPIIPSTSVQIPNQVLPTQGVNPYVNQMNFGQMIGRINSVNPDATAIAGQWINDAVRTIYDRKTWYGLFTKGQVVCPAAIVGGTAATTLGSASVVGTNTAWTADVVGRQFRIGYNNPIYTIIGVDTVNQVLTLEMPWGSPSVSSGYFIAQYYFNIGPNIKYIKTMVNMIQAIKIRLNLTQDLLNNIDPWRQSGGVFPWGVAAVPPDSNGNYIIELYPLSWIQQALPFLAYTQPPNLVNDSDALPPYIRADVVIKHAIAEALIWRGPRQNPYYDAAESARKRADFEAELLKMADNDENLYRTNLIYPGEGLPYYTPGGGLWDAMHPIMAGGGGGWDDY